MLTLVVFVPSNSIGAPSVTSCCADHYTCVCDEMPLLGGSLNGRRSTQSEASFASDARSSISCGDNKIVDADNYRDCDRIS